MVALHVAEPVGWHSQRKVIDPSRLPRASRLHWTPGCGQGLTQTGGAVALDCVACAPDVHIYPRPGMEVVVAAAGKRIRKAGTPGPDGEIVARERPRVWIGLAGGTILEQPALVCARRCIVGHGPFRE